MFVLCVQLVHPCFFFVSPQEERVPPLAILEGVREEGFLFVGVWVSPILFF